jgi:hypothetical protein
MNAFLNGTVTLRRDLLAGLALIGALLSFILALALYQGGQQPSTGAMYRGTDTGRTEVCIARTEPGVFTPVECVAWQDITPDAAPAAAAPAPVIVQAPAPAAAAAPIIVQAPPAATQAPAPVVRPDTAKYRTHHDTGRRQLCVSKYLPKYSSVYRCDQWVNVRPAR